MAKRFAPFQRKFGGMLTEASIDCRKVKTLIFGFGLNLNASCKKFPKISSSNRLRSTVFMVSGSVSMKLQRRSSRLFFLAYDDCLQGKEWRKISLVNGKKWMHSINRKIKISLGNERIISEAYGIDTDGGLRVKLHAMDGRKSFRSDVTLGQ